MNTLNPQYPEDDGPIPDEYFLFLTEHAKSLLPPEKLFQASRFSMIQRSDHLKMAINAGAGHYFG